MEITKAEKNRLRMQRKRAQEKENETQEEREQRLLKQREQKLASRNKIRGEKNLPPARPKAPPRKKQDYKVDSTDDQNLSRVLRLNEALGGSIDEIDFELISDQDVIKQYIDETYTNLNTKRSYYASLVKVLSDLGPEDKDSLATIEFYRKEMMDIKKEVDKQVAENKKTRKEEERWLNWETIKVQ